MKIISLAILLSAFVYVECLPKANTTKHGDSELVYIGDENYPSPFSQKEGLAESNSIELVYVGDENYPSPFSKKEGEAESNFICGGKRKCKGSKSDKRLAKIRKGLDKMRNMGKWGTYSYDGIYLQAKNWHAWSSAYDCWNHNPSQLEGDAKNRGYLASYIEFCSGTAKCSTQYWIDGC
jgi:hypothetical protein